MRVGELLLAHGSRTWPVSPGRWRSGRVSYYLLSAAPSQSAVSISLAG